MSTVVPMSEKNKAITANNLIAQSEEYFNKKLYGKCLRLIEQVANQTEDLNKRENACFSLGKIYYYGWGVERNYVKAASFFKQILQTPNPNVKAAAQIFLGQCYI